MEKLFRYTVVISTLLFILLYILPFIDYLCLTEEELNLATYNGFGATLPNNMFIYWGLFSVWVAISVGLFLFIPIARTAFVAMQVLTLIASFLYGFSVQPAVSITVGDIVVMADGALLVMLYLTSVSQRFEKTPNN